jgi:hypothetical protein
MKNIQQLVDSHVLIGQIMKELDCSNVKAIGFHKEKWVVKYHKGKQNKFNLFSEMYEFLSTESNN